MATAQKQKARSDIWKIGFKEPASNKQGYTIDRSKPWGTGDEIIVHKGQEYWRWQHRDGELQISLTEPSRQTLTSNQFIRRAYDWEDKVAKWCQPANLYNDITSFGVELREIYVECKAFYEDKMAWVEQLNRAKEYLHTLRQLMNMMLELKKIRDVLPPQTSMNAVDIMLIEDSVRKVKFTPFTYEKDTTQTNPRMAGNERREP